MRFDVITLFPELFEPFVRVGINRRAFETGAVELHCFNPRDAVTDTYRRVDDRPFGGGPGMVFMAQPLFDTLAAIRQQRGDQAPVVLFSPLGSRLDHAAVQEWSDSAGAILICGRYEGVDQRFIDAHVDRQISLGDFVLSGGEIAAMALIDAVARLQPGVLGDQDSHHFDSFNPALDGLLDCPHYTRPEQWHDVPVPAVLTSGNHQQIALWRRQQSLRSTAALRPELLARARAAGALAEQDEAFLRGLEAQPKGG